MTLEHARRWTSRLLVVIRDATTDADRGGRRDSIKAGERVTVTGNPTHTGSQKMFFRRLVRADGTELLPGNAQRLNTIEEQRRQRARQRER